MSYCAHCVDAEDLFGEKAAKRDLRRYRRRGPLASAEHLVRMLRAEGVEGRTLLDIGGGVGALQHELIGSGVVRTLQVDASAAYLRASAQEAARRGHGAASEYRHGDFVDLAEGLRSEDIVTLDRVVCCYPDMPRLVAASTAKARVLYGLAFPRQRLGTRVLVAGANGFFRLKRSAFRTYLHPPARIAAEIRRNGFELVSEAQTFLWSVAVYRRSAR
jgi:hypothetical protein